MKEKYGFVYIWYDKKHKRFYIGSHWGTEDDGYICSSTWMRNSYKRRPRDFKRRILKRIYERSMLLENEQKWIDFIKPDEIKIRYYNLNLKIGGNWSHNPDSLKTVGEKISRALKGKFFPNKGHFKKGRKNTGSEFKKGSIPPNKGQKASLETRKKLSEAHKGNIPANAQPIKTPYGIYHSISKARRELNLTRTQVINNLKNDPNNWNIIENKAYNG